LALIYFLIWQISLVIIKSHFLQLIAHLEQLIPILRDDLFVLPRQCKEISSNKVFNIIDGAIIHHPDSHPVVSLQTNRSFPLVAKEGNLEIKNLTDKDNF